MKWLLTLALLFAGCGGAGSNPCDDVLTEGAQNGGRVFIELLLLEGIPISVIRAEFPEGIARIGNECFDSLLDLALEE